MIAKTRRLILLGPQKDYSSLRASLSQLAIDGPVAIVTAGWEEDESQDEALRAAIGIDSVNLHLFERSEELFRDDPELIQLLQDRQDELRTLRDVYRMRLDLGLTAARKMVTILQQETGFEPECDSSIEFVRQLDRQYFVRTSQICDRYEDRLKTPQRPAVMRHRAEIQQMLQTVDAVLISGGHAAIILNRLKIFGVLELSDPLPIVAWSGGAMALADQIVFFHDSPPQGAGNPEVLRAGMGLYDRVLPLPDARTRLRLKDGTRVKLFAKRFDDYACVILDEHTILDRDHGVWTAMGDATALDPSGQLVEFQP